jgi:hypothetical protein
MTCLYKKQSQVTSINSYTDISPRILKLKRDIESGNRAALDAFWQEMVQR